MVHGAGSFGHFEASQYGITKPHTPQATLLEGFAKTRRSVTRLNQLVVSALVDAGVPAVGLSPCGVCFSSNGALSPAWQQGYVDAVQALLSRWVPHCWYGYVSSTTARDTASDKFPGLCRVLCPAVLAGATKRDASAASASSCGDRQIHTACVSCSIAYCCRVPAVA